MKIKLLTICLLLFTSQVFAETWSCTYEFKGETKLHVVVIKENKVYMRGKLHNYKTILLNNKNFLHIYTSYPSLENVTFYSEVYNRITKRFSMVGIVAIKNENTVIIEGDCIITK